MSLSDPVADMLTKIRNASSARFESVDIPTSKLKLEITKILKNEGYIKTFKKVTQDGPQPHPDLPEVRRRQRAGHPRPEADLHAGPPDVRRLQARSRGSSTGSGPSSSRPPLGVTTGKKALEKKAGGELICSVW